MPLRPRVLSGAGCKLVLTAGKKAELEAIVRECRDWAQRRGGEYPSVSEEHVPGIVAKAVEAALGGSTFWWSRPARTMSPKSHDMAPARFLDVMDANVTQSWLMARAVTMQMQKQNEGGKIVLMSSARGLLGHPAGYTAYCASKSAVDGITKALGCELGPSGITVNAIAPTVFRSPLTEWMFGDDEKAKTTRTGLSGPRAEGSAG